jgi:hypothetical protein
MSTALRTRVLVGSAVWLAGLGGAAVLFASPGVREPLHRTARAFTDDVFGAPERERWFALADLRGVDVGAPVFRISEGALEAPVGHVVGIGGEGVRVRLVAPLGAGAWRLDSLPPSRSLGEAVSLAVPPEAAARLGAAFRTRLAATFEEALLPGLERRLPAFLARIDPTKDAAARVLFESVGSAVLARLTPLLEDLTSEITTAVKARFDFLDRLGLLWKVLRGDEKGLEKELVPVAREAARAWWAAHGSEALAAVAAGVTDRREALEAWLRGPAWAAARDELLLPVVREERDRLTGEVEALLRQAVEEVALAPGGGFRPRFASVLRTHLFGRGEALLLLSDGSVR